MPPSPNIATVLPGAGFRSFVTIPAPVGKAQPGDIVFFQFDADAEADHVGICASNDGKKYLMVYEGNTSGDAKGSQSNGDGVYLKKRAYSLVMGVARP